MAEASTTMKIPQFDGTNFSNWKYRVGTLLDEKGLKLYIENDISDLLKAEKDATKHVAVNFGEKKCISLLVQSIHDSQLEYVREKETAKQMYDTLCSIFERKSISSQLLYRKQLLLMKYDDSNEIIEHILQFDTKVRELKSTGAKMEELDIVVHLLLTLPKSYDNLVTALETMDQSKLSVEFVKTRLMDEHNKRTGGNSLGKPSEPGAMSAKGKSKQVICFGCGKAGHIKSRCKSKNKGKNAKYDSQSANEASNDKQSTMCAVVNEQASLCNGKLTVNKAQAAQSDDEATKIKFILDSGATQHMVNDKRYFDKLNNIDEIQIAVAKKNQSISAKQQGDISVKTFHENDTSTKTMENVLLVKDLKCNLMSIRSLTKRGYNILFEGDYAYASLNGETKFVAHTEGKLYEVVLHLESNVFAGFSGECNLQKISQSLWHYRLGHLNASDIEKLAKHQMAIGLEKVNANIESKFCESCVFGKQAKKPFPKNKNPRSSRILEMIHTDVCGPLPTTAYDGSRYFVSFIDDYSRASMIYCIKKKSEVFGKFKEFVAMAEALHGNKVAKLKMDNGGEYVSKEIKDFCTEKGIQMLYTVAHNPQMNGVAERLNRTLQEKAATMLLAGKIDEKFWNEAILTANYVKNRSPTSAYGKRFARKTPAEIWFKQKPDLSHLRIFGSECYNHIPACNRSKLEAKSTKCIMFGYGASMGTYRLWELNRNKLIFGRNVTFNEASVLNQSKLMEIFDSEAETNKNLNDFVDGGMDDTLNDAGDNLSNDQDDSRITGDEDDDIHSTNGNCAGNGNQVDHGVNSDGTGDDKDKVNSAGKNGTGNSDRNFPRRGDRNRRAPERFGDWAQECETAHFALSAEQYVEDDPMSIAEAKNRNDWPEWKKAIDSEYQSLLKNKTWTACDLPKNRNAISNKWVFKLKRKADGTVDKYKARLVARGFSQKLGFDYNETYAPVAKLVTLKILLAIASKEDMHIHQMDVKCAFLNGELNEDIYMQLPDGFNKGNKVCKLNKALYGLKQASRAWNEKFNEFMIRIGFTRCKSDQCLYVKEANGVICYVLLYVDDTLIICRDIKMISTVKRLLSKEFEMTDVGRASSFLGMQIEHDMKTGSITLSQSQYLQNVLKKFGMEDSKPKSTPMEKSLHLEKGDENNCSKCPYRELVGCLMYATVTTRPDLCAATGYLSRYQSCFDDRHFNHAKHILRYIKGTIDLKLVFNRHDDKQTLIGYSDSDWGGDKNDSKSTSGYVFKLFGNTISWASRKQPTVSISSTEAEYVALAEAICEGEWIKKLLAELKIPFTEPIPLFEDNTSCIKIAEEPREYKRMKHLDIKYDFIRDMVSKGKYELFYISTDEQVADIMTKALGRNLFVKHRNNLNLL